MPGPNHTSRVTGQDAIIKAPEGNEIAVSSVSFDIDVNTTDVQTDRSMRADIVTTGLRYSGSFEYDGSQDTIRGNLFYSADDTAVSEGDKQAGEPKRVNMTVKEENDASDSGFRKWSLENIVVTGMSRDIPADDVASTSWDFEAEDVYVMDGGVDGGSSRAQ